MIITLKGADFSASNIGTLSSWRITRSLGTGATYEGPTSVDKGAAFNATVTIAEGYELGTAGVTVTMGGNVISAATINGNVITINIAEVTGNVTIKVPTVNINTGEEDEPDTPTTQVYGTLIESPTNLRGGSVEYIIVKPEFYSSILNKKITKIRLYRVVDSSSASKTTIRVGKVVLSGEFKPSSQTTTSLNEAYANMTSDRTYDVSLYSANTAMELDCDITLSDGEYLCFNLKNGHCVGYCNNSASAPQMMYIYNSKVEPTQATSTQVPISVTVEE